jgi:hypothetical protein
MSAVLSNPSLAVLTRDVETTSELAFACDDAVEDVLPDEAEPPQAARDTVSKPASTAARAFVMVFVVFSMV